MYKVLVRSVIDYASVISIASSDEVIRKLEVMQNNALRIIFKVSFNDHVSVDTLRSWAGVESIADRHRQLLPNYYEKAIVTNNPLVNQLFKNYKDFKERKLISENLAVKRDGSIDLVSLNLIRAINKGFLNKELHKTTLCMADSVIREMILDSFGEGLASSAPD